MDPGYWFDQVHQPGEQVPVPLGQGVELPLVWCPAGEFLMGTSEAEAQLLDQLAGGDACTSVEQPQHKVTLSEGFWMGKTPVTIEQWERFMPPDELFGLPPQESRRCPMIGITWDDAVAWTGHLTQFLQHQGWLYPPQCCELPTEAQWEYACRAGTTTPWYFGTDLTELDQHAWYTANTDYLAYPVGRKRPNPWGLHDLYGSVLEWCLDDMFAYHITIQSPIDPVYILHQNGKQTGAAVRGGDSGSRAIDCRSAERYTILSKNDFGEATGLRPVLVQQTSQRHAKIKNYSRT